MLVGNLKIPGPGYALFVELQMQLPMESLAGNTSSTDTAEKGVQPKTFSCSFSVRSKTEDLAWLATFIKLAEERDGKGEAIKYDVVHPLTTALRIRQVQYTGQVDVRQHQTLRQYDVSFTLQEYKSVPEAAEQRIENRTVPGGQPRDTFQTIVDKIEAQTG